MTVMTKPEAETTTGILRDYPLWMQSHESDDEGALFSDWELYPEVEQRTSHLESRYLRGAARAADALRGLPGPQMAEFLAGLTRVMWLKLMGLDDDEIAEDLKTQPLNLREEIEQLTAMIAVKQMNG